MFLRAALIVIAFSGIGCATAGLQSRDVLSNRKDIPARAEIRNVPLVKQEIGQCGPATLTMIMNQAGVPVNIEQVTSQVFLAQQKGTLQTDMVRASRQQGLLAIEISGLRDLLKEVAAGHPVIVFENLGLSWLPKWHYALVLGYDLDSQEIIMHSGDEAYRRTTMNRFERDWMLGDYWGMVVLPTFQLSATADELTHLRAAVALEKANQSPAAERVYLSVLTKWPTSLGALIGLGNLSFGRKDYRAAINYLSQAEKHHPGSEAARNNLAVARQYAKSTLR